MAALVGDLRHTRSGIDRPALFRLPDHFLVQELAAALAERLDDPGAMVEIVPEPLGVEEMQLLLVIAEELAKAGIVEEEPPVLVDEAEGGRAVLEEIAELAFVLGDLRLALRAAP